MWVNSKKWLVGLLLVWLLSVLSLPMFSEETVKLSADEYNAVMNSLTAAEKALTEAKSEINRLNQIIERQSKTLIEQEQILMKQLEMWPMLNQFWTEQKNALKAEYWRGFKDGSLISGLSLFIIGNLSGFKLGISIPLQ